MLQRLFFLALFLLSCFVAQAQYFGESESHYHLRGIPFDATCQEGDGLMAEYFRDTRMRRSIMTVKEPQINFYHFNSQRYPNVPAHRFTTRWEGYLYSPEDGQYIFTVRADDGIRVWIDGKLMLDEWHEQMVESYDFEAWMRRGELHTLKVEYLQLQLQHAVAELHWQYRGQKKMLVPTEYLYTAPSSLCYEREEILETPTTEETVVATTRKVVIQPAKKVAFQDEVKKIAQDTLTVVRMVKKERKWFENLPNVETIALKNLYFQQGKYEFREDETTQQTLEELAFALQKFDEVKVKIVGHTDNVGNYRANLRLSRNRASRVVSYLVQHGIDPKRLSSEGFGSDQPIDTNNTEEGRRNNRRVELVVVKKQ